ncbi:MAG: hypothetical protein QN173_05060 [Armatimonadota bacterium]|nr:hypothetical protein [Armatimonadota bacterium]MDR7401833.1 hypothetical protein [Armatimonadota bacterium]MDR7405093.1 hypothetical protein [Armatimonadota bacterium]MDR7437451.1 hypothetical protein [Armatimonadota bacterium]MDR7473202.1 hypothetical protein [Armatimonadota bacterium]
MAALLTVHASRYLAVAVIVGNAALALWAFRAHVGGRRTLGAAFWTVLLAVAALTVVQAASGAVLALGGARPRTALHFLYGGLVVAGAVAQVGLRPGGFLRPALHNPGAAGPSAFALLCLTQAALVGRAFTTGAWGR